jgi:hypothetical protein
MAPVKLNAPPTENAKIIRGHRIFDSIAYWSPSFEFRISGNSLIEILISPVSNENNAETSVNANRIRTNSNHLEYFLFMIIVH